MTIISLWLPILLSAVGVFIASSIIHMLLGYHNSNFSQLPDEESFLENTGKLNITPGEYMFPYGGSPKAMEDPIFLEKLNKGPVGMMTVMPNGPYAMGRNLLLWFIYSLFIGVFCAYIAINSLSAEAEYLAVMRIVGATAFAVYALGHLQESIWYSRSWKTTGKFVFDGLVYALLTGGVFGCLWA